MSSTPEPNERPYRPTPPEELLARAKRRSAATRRHRIVGGSGSLTVLAAILVVGVLISGPGKSPAPSTRSPGQLVVSARIGNAYELTAGEKASAAAPQAVTSSVENAEVGFALALLKNLAATPSSTAPDNVLASPSSLATALAMLELGAEASTQSQIAATLQSAGLSPSEQAAGWYSLASLLGDETSTEATSIRHEPELDIANALFLQQHFAVLPAFVRALSSDFATGLWQVDFHGHLAAAVAAMNEWTSDHTHGLINRLFSPGAISPRTVMVLADAVYFRADWAQSFEKATVLRSFYPAGGTAENVPFMVSAAADSPHAMTVPVSRSGDYVALELPYAGHKLSALGGHADSLVTCPVRRLARPDPPGPARGRDGARDRPGLDARVHHRLRLPAQ